MNRLIPLLGAALAACGGAASSAPPPSPTPAVPAVGAAATVGNLSVTVGQQFNLHVGQSAMIGGASSVVLFKGVGSDSRCPSGTQCVQAGNAEADFTVTTNGNSANVALNTNSDPKEAMLGENHLRLVSLAPLPGAGGMVDPSAYVATVCVCR